MVMQQTLTLEEFLALPEEKPNREFVYGRATPKPMTNSDHYQLVNALLFELTLHARRAGGRLGPEASVLLGPDADQRVLMPVAAYWAPGVEMGFYPVHPPTLAVEVR